MKNWIGNWSRISAALAFVCTLFVLPALAQQYDSGVTGAGATPPPYVAGIGKAVSFYKDLNNGSQTIILQANSKRVYADIQCTGGGNVGVSRTGQTLTGPAPSSTNPVDLVIPSGTTPYFTAPIFTQAQINGYTSTAAQACWGVEYIR